MTGSTPRKAMTRQRRLRIFEAHGGVCILCGLPIDGTKQAWTIEHMRALGLAGADDDANCGPAHEACRRDKDKADLKAIAKAKRRKMKAIGIAAQPTRPIRSRNDLARGSKRKQNPMPMPARRAMFGKVT